MGDRMEAALPVPNEPGPQDEEALPMDLNLVVRRRHWVAPDENWLEYLTGEETWSKDPRAAWLYSSMVAFEEARQHGGHVFIRLPAGREEIVRREDFAVTAQKGSSR